MTALRVLHVSTFDREGGAARAARRLHLALRQYGVDSQMLVMHRAGDDPHVWQPRGPAWRGARRVLDAIADYALRLQRTPTNTVLHSINLFPSGLGRWINEHAFDVVHLHWVGSDMLSVEEIGRLVQPLCWTLHDTWAFSGTEHYDDLAHPGRYLEAYSPANRPPGYSGLDVDAWNWCRKERAWRDQRFELVAPSHWMAQAARASRLLGSHACSVIHNAVDTEVFQPVDRSHARQALGLDPDRRYVLFGAATGAQDRRKGFHLLLEALRELAQRPGVPSETELLIFGAAPQELLRTLPLRAHAMGYVGDEARLALLYAAADVFAAPSMQDNLPNTVAEALACGTPAVAFGIGGLPELVRHQVTGWLAPAFNTVDFADGLAYALRTPGLGETCRADAVARFSYGSVAAQHAALYRRMVTQASSRESRAAARAAPQSCDAGGAC